MLHVVPMSPSFAQLRKSPLPARRSVKTAEQEIVAASKEAVRREVARFRRERKEYFGLKRVVRECDEILSAFERDIEAVEAAGQDPEQLQDAMRVALGDRRKSGVKLADARAIFVKRLAEHRERVKAYRAIRDSSLRALKYERSTANGDNSKA